MATKPTDDDVYDDAPPAHELDEDLTACRAVDGREVCGIELSDPDNPDAYIFSSEFVALTQ